MALNTAEKQALREFATAHGRTWKCKLRQAWMQGSSGPLQALRNASYFGPAGLDKLKLGDLEGPTLEDGAYWIRVPWTNTVTNVTNPGIWELCNVYTYQGRQHVRAMDWREKLSRMVSAEFSPIARPN